MNFFKTRTRILIKVLDKQIKMKKSIKIIARVIKNKNKKNLKTKKNKKN